MVIQSGKRWVRRTYRALCRRAPIRSWRDGARESNALKRSFIPGLLIVLLGGGLLLNNLGLLHLAVYARATCGRAPPLCWASASPSPTAAWTFSASL